MKAPLEFLSDYHNRKPEPLGLVERLAARDAEHEAEKAKLRAECQQLREVSDPCSHWADAVKLGDARARRRIRRAQAKALKLIRSPNSGMARDYYADIIDAATRAKPRSGK